MILPEMTSGTWPVMSPTVLASIANGLAAVYVICTIVGGGLLVISTVFGGHGDSDVDTDVSFDVHTDVSLDMHADADADIDLGTADASTGMDHVDGDIAADHGGLLELSNWFSIRFVVYFTAAFGCTGTILTYMTDVSWTRVLIASLAAGLVVGQGVHQLIAALRRGSGDSSVKPEDFVDQPARVTIAINPPSRGEIAVKAGGTERFVCAAASRADDSFAVGDRVIVVSYQAGTAEVMSQQEHEFLKST